MRLDDGQSREKENGQREIIPIIRYRRRKSRAPLRSLFSLFWLAPPLACVPKYCVPHTLSALRGPTRSWERSAGNEARVAPAG